jgi:hypothetical protein
MNRIDLNFSLVVCRLLGEVDLNDCGAGSSVDRPSSTLGTLRIVTTSETARNFDNCHILFRRFIFGVGRQTVQLEVRRA